jgi:hypothetical protein
MDLIALSCKVSHMEWMISKALKNNGCYLSTDKSTSLGMTHLTSIGIKSGWMVHGSTRKHDRSEPSTVEGANSKFR